MAESLQDKTTGWAPTGAQLALELAQNPITDDESFLQWVERHAKRYLIVTREAERSRCAAIAARIGNSGDYKAMAVASAIMREIENGD
jgi:hypothetical protein